MIARIAAVLSIPLVTLALWGVTRQVRRPSTLRGWMPLVGLVMAPLGLMLNLVILQQATPGAAGWAFGAAGLVFGLVWNRTTHLDVRSGRVLARRSALYLVLWGVSYAITQVLAALTVARWVSTGLAALWFATGTAVGMNLDLLLRWTLARRRYRPPDETEAQLQVLSTGSTSRANSLIDASASS